MSSVNPYFTFHYSQPAEYSFSHDSVFLARKVFEYCQRDSFFVKRGLDLCSGCGIVGLDFLFHARKENFFLPEIFDFLEIQEIYRDHFEENRTRLGEHPTRTQFLPQNYEDMDSQKGIYDLILCNPPYFRLGQGSLSPSEFKNRCRFFMDSDFPHLIGALSQSLSERGRSFVLLRDLAAHGRNPFAEASQFLGKEFSVDKVGEIRGTDLVQIQRKN